MRFNPTAQSRPGFSNILGVSATYRRNYPNYLGLAFASKIIGSSILIGKLVMGGVLNASRYTYEEFMIYAKWMRYDERTNALDYLEKCYNFIKTVEKERQNWKWVIITLHSAIYGFAISACRGTNYQSVIIKTPKGHEILIDFDEAMKRCQDTRWMMVNTDYKLFKLSPQQKESLRSLHKVFRNNFEHFTPKSWSIEIHDMPIMILDCLEILKYLVINSDVAWRLKSSGLRRVKSILFNSRKIINGSMLYKEAIILHNPN